MRFFFFFLPLIASAYVFSQETSPYFQQELNYEIHVTLDDVNHRLNGNITIQYKNNSPQTLNYIYFHLWPNAYKNYKTALAQQKLEEGNTDMYYANDSLLGFIDGLEFKINNESANWSYTLDFEDVAIVNLVKPLQPGESIEISTPFNVKLPKGIFSRLGHINQSYQITQWYPKPAVYDKNGWHQMPYLDQGEFYSEYGTYNVFITLPKNYRVAATGDLVDNIEEEKWLDSLAIVTKSKRFFEVDDMKFPASSSELKTLHYHQEKVHDFAWFADKRYHVLKGEIEMPLSKRKITTWAMFTNAEAELWIESITYLNDATYFYSVWNGEYPYNQVTAVDGSISAGGGMEYPNVTVIGSSGNAFSLETVIMHEVGHNWFYGILGSNEREHPWMDEGINSANELRYIKTKYPERKLIGDVTNETASKLVKWLDLLQYQHKAQYELSYLINAKKNLDQPIEFPAAEYTPLNYGGIVYSKTAISFDFLRVYLGNEIYDKCMHRYFEEWKFKHPQPEDLRKIFEEETGKNLDWFFNDIIKSTKKIDYKISRAKKDSLGNPLLLIKNKQKIATPFSVSGIKDGEVVVKQWYEPITTKAFVPFPKGDYSHYKIDEALEIPEIKRKNNTLRARGMLKRTEPLRFQLMGSLENPDKTQLFFTPIVGWNNNDKFMAGLAFYNLTIPARKFEYILAPMYAFETKEINGYASAFYHITPNAIFQDIAVGGTAKSFTYLNIGNQERKYYKLAPKIDVEFKKKRQRDRIYTYFNYEYDYIIEETTDFIRDANENAFSILVNEHFYVNNLNVGIENYHVINSYDASLNLQQHTDFVKLSATANYRFAYKKPQTGLDVRFFIGGFLYNSDEGLNSRFNFNLSGGQASDYLYNEHFLGRNDINGNFNQQTAILDGGFKNPVLAEADNQFVLANRWLNSLNIKSNVFSKYLALYADFGIVGSVVKDALGNETNKTSDVVYNYGAALVIIPNFFEIYFPFKSSSDLNQLKYHDRISFILNINLLNPHKMVRNLDI